LLPASALANLGMTANARALEHAIRKMLSHPLEEVRQIGRLVKEAAQAEVPTLVKYADRTPYLVESEARLEAWPSGEATNADWLELVTYDPHGQEAVLAAALYRHGLGTLAGIRGQIEAMDPATRDRLAGDLLGGMDRFDVPLRDLEHTAYTFDAVMDQGAYFEVKRHRMMTQSPQRLSAELGYATPQLFREAGVQPDYRRAMDAAGEAYRELAAWNPEVAAYVVPNGFRRRVALVLNLREAYHFCELRSAANAHFSVRRLAFRMAEEIRNVHPSLAAAMRLPAPADWRAIEAEHFLEA
jgi:thymidylate synthase ThyX